MRFQRPRFFYGLVLFGLTYFALQPVQGQEPNWFTINSNGGWCWFQDERAIIDNGKILVGSVKSPQGDVDLNIVDIQSGESQTVTLHEGLQSDDHAVPALLALPGGRYLAVYSKHGNDRLMRYRISITPGDAAQWRPERTFDAGANVTYSNLFQLSAQNNRIYNFHRGIGWDPNFVTSDNHGRRWQYGGHLLKNANDPNNRMRPYLKYASDHVDAIHFVATEAHPQQFDGTSIYHGYFKNGALYHSNGEKIRSLEEGSTDPAELTRLFRGTADAEAWTVDLHLNEAGRPYTVFSVHHANDDHRYYYARWDGEAWQAHEMAYAGTRLYPGENHYTGLAAIDPDDLDTVYISTDAHPETGAPLISEADDLRHYEIYRGATPDGGKTWQWEAVTQNSNVDNLRPIVPQWNPRQTALLWLRGTYRTYQDYDLTVVGKIIENTSAVK